MRVTLRNPTRVVEVDSAARVQDLLQRLDLHPDTVLVIRSGELLHRDDPLSPADDVEVRSVISGGAHARPGRGARRPPRRGGRGPVRCRRCGEEGRVDVPSANARLCNDCFLHYVRTKVTRTIEQERMFSRADRLLVAVSGGKDSLVLWDILLDLGYDATGYHLVLWTGEEYAADSRERCRRFAAERGARLAVHDLAADEGYTIEQVAKEARRVPCSVCGLSKRYLLNRAAVQGGFDVLVTGHNLDDEAATLLGNVLHWTHEMLARQRPVLEASGAGLSRKVKPLVRVLERETAAYAILRGIDYIVEECPLVAGNTQLRYKEALNLLESNSPGTKHQFVMGFHRTAAHHFEAGGRQRADAQPPDGQPPDAQPPDGQPPDGQPPDGQPADGQPAHGAVLNACAACGMPTPGEICAYCRAVRPLRLAAARETGAKDGGDAGRSDP